ncbi:MAG: diguanylate cyclase [Onishia taeanensis]|uniref:diguanylate cyclase n=1 Tax=Halomonadaceae TaxID=28256 RepID=UPI002714CECC|nr:diguanylate cyclase [Halomonas sp. I5-271120]
MDKEDLYKKRLELALEASGLDLWENDLSTGEVVFGLTKVFADLGYETYETATYVADIFKLVHPDDVSAVTQAVDDHISGITERYYSEFRIRAKRGAWVWYANYGKIVENDGSMTRFTGVCFNLDEKKHQEQELQALNERLTEQNMLLERMNAELHMLATYDSMTGLYNRRHLINVGEREIRRAQRFEHPLALMIIDIDFFKRVNDTWGHIAGDQVIRAVADCCLQQTREQVDTVGRIGGEEFAVVLPETTLHNTLALAERLRERIATSRIPLIDGQTISVTVSIGAAELQPAFTSLNDLMMYADRALYRAKRAGRNQVNGQGW